MSEAHSTPEESPIAKVMNSILMLGVPALLLMMLAVSGFFFVAGMGDTEEEKATAAEEIAAAEAAVEATGVAAVAAPPVAGGAPAPAAAPAGGGLPEGVTQEFWDLGKSSYATCAACHGADGKGLQAGPMKMAPSFHVADGELKLLLDENPDKAILTILKGIQKEGMDYLGMMAALGAGLSDDQIASVLTYLRNSYGNSASPVSPEQVAKAREKYAGVDAPAGVKRSEIDAIVNAP